VTVSFDRLGEIVPGGLPPNAFVQDAWWANELDDTRHVQSAAGWVAAGYRVAHVDRAAKLVTFELAKQRQTGSLQTRPASSGIG
jgi:hypothetical protein